MTIRKRIDLGCSTAIAVALGFGIFAYLRLVAIETHATRITAHCLPAMVSTVEITSLARKNYIARLRHVSTNKAEEKAAIMAVIQTNVALINKLTNEYAGTITTAHHRELFATMIEARATYLGAFKEAAKLSDAGKNKEAQDVVIAHVQPAFDAFDHGLDALVRFNKEDADESGSQITATVRSAQVGILIGLCTAFVLACGIAWFISRTTNLALRGVTQTLDNGAVQVAATAVQVSSTSQSLAEGASEQAASLQETSAALEEIASMTRRNSQNAQSAKEFAAETRTAAESGVQSTCEMGRAMQGIRTASDEMRDAMNGIKTASKDVSKIIKTIDEIAFQTNILALNAAVEAARAGEAGMGFAVVADEVRNLAQRSAKAAKETADMIEASIKRSEDGVRVTEKVTGAVEDVTERSKQLEGKLAEMLAKAQQVDEQVAQIALSSQEQSQGISEVNMAVGQMSQITQSNAAGAEESAAAAEELNSQAAMLNDTVASLRQLVGGGAQAAWEHRVEPCATASAVRSLAASGKPAQHKLDNRGTGSAKAGVLSKPTARKLAGIARNTDIPMPEPIGAGSAKNRLERF